MVCVKAPVCVLLFICANTAHSAEDHDSKGDVDMMPRPQEKYQRHYKASERLTRSVDDALNEIDDGIDSMSSSARSLTPRVLQKSDQCDLAEIQRMHKQCVCHSPKKQCVRINDLDSTAMLTMPECVIVERCEGICPHSKSCLPKIVELVSIPIMIMGRGRSSGGRPGSAQPSYECKTIQVEKHVRCECGCNKSKGDCYAKQAFNPSLCQCECLNPLKAEQCKKQNKIWNASTCECVCPSNISQICSTGAFFHKTQCKCVPTEAEKAWKPRKVPPRHNVH